MATRKICRKCSKRRSVTMFSKRSSSPDGLQYFCRDCMNEYGKEWRKENAEHRRTYFSQWYQANLESRREYAREYRKKNHKKIAEYMRNYRAKKKLEAQAN